MFEAPSRSIEYIGALYRLDPDPFLSSGRRGDRLVKRASPLVPIVEPYISRIARAVSSGPSTLMRQVEIIVSSLTRLGTVMTASPSFSVLAASTIGKVIPLSVDSVILTFAQATGETFVLATYHVMCLRVSGVHCNGRFGHDFCRRRKINTLIKHNLKK